MMFHAPYRLRGGWFCLVGGKEHGPWPDKGSAIAGYETEMRRYSAKLALQIRGQA
jgi:hypothetical protein